MHKLVNNAHVHMCILPRLVKRQVHFILDTVCNMHDSLLDGCELGCTEGLNGCALDCAEGISSSAKVINQTSALNLMVVTIL